MERTLEFIKTLQDEIMSHVELIGTISVVYDIPLEEINELKARLKRDKKLSEAIKTQTKQAAKKKLDKLIPRVKVV